ncbi:MAG: SDR family oxidoreductase [Candidatus Dormibacteraeota bacterium]|uniref:SDR family oxidoreductase n=1 Tax=Candidatus Aeolococcus gillhamiae TaxID=3127015 RepID=A0A2W6AWB5_9BACT|nr:SDR family oxidoreductase [Candidatus Dormibacteraeota bacterium]PZR82211.1 MAG: short-chain dehydrogenase [Candidatus Dormibacter sp. RRmetagenome_bin12]
MTTSSRTTPTPRVAYVSGGSRGLGHALSTELVRRGWHVVIDGRDAGRLAAAAAAMPEPASVSAIPGDVADPDHRGRIAAAVAAAGGLDLVVNNASVLGPSPQPRLAEYPLAALAAVYAVNTFAPVALLQLLLPHLAERQGRVINVSSDAATEPYEGWGGYGSSKAALDHITAILGVEHPGLRVYAFDPGDMRTDLQQQAFPGEDISDRPTAESVVPSLVRLVEGELPSGRYTVGELANSATSP